MIGEIYRTHSISCLKNLWYRLRAYGQPENSMPLPPNVLFAFSSPALTNRIRVARGVATGVMGRCVEALVVKELVAGVKPSTNSNIQSRNNKLASLSAILGAESNDVKFCLECHGAIELATMVSLAFGDVGPLAVNALPSDVRYVAQQTLAILYQTAELLLDQPIAQLNISDANFDHIISSGFHKLLQMCITGTSPLPAEVRRSCLRMCLKSMWYCAEAYHQLGASKPLPSYFPRALASKEIVRRIHTERDPVSRVVGRCFCALVVMKLVADFRSRADSNVQISDDELVCISAILGTPDNDMTYWLKQPGAIELMNVAFLAFDDIGSFAADTVPSYVLDVIPETFSIISQSLPAEISIEPGLDQTDAQTDIPGGQFEHILYPITTV